jgi:hypothetical protein
MSRTLAGFRHCRWCGRFVSKESEPISGYNSRLEVISQTLCQECGPQWVELSNRNVERANRPAKDLYVRAEP